MAHVHFDRDAALKEFDDTKGGVRGLIEAGKAATLPPIFRHSIIRPLSSSSSDEPTDLSIPTIDLCIPRPIAVSLVSAATRDWGFFQVVNHGIPLPLIERCIAANRAFHELPPADRAPFYSREFVGGVSYVSNFDLYRSAAASWRDTLQVALSPVRPDPECIPPVVREEIMAFDESLVGVVKNLMGLLSEGLGLSPGRLEETSCLEWRLMVAHYYPPCPEPEMTVGTEEHTDAVAVTVLLQDSVGGLQVKKRMDGKEKGVWVDVQPVAGALVVNVGDLLQIMSNDVYKSVEHRVLANSKQEARTSIAVFFNPGKNWESDLYGPLPELLPPSQLDDQDHAAAAAAAHYRSFTMAEFMGTFYAKRLASKTLTQHFKL